MPNKSATFENTVAAHFRAEELIAAAMDSDEDRLNALMGDVFEDFTASTLALVTIANAAINYASELSGHDAGDVRESVTAFVLRVYEDLTDPDIDGESNRG